LAKLNIICQIAAIAGYGASHKLVMCSKSTTNECEIIFARRKQQVFFQGEAIFCWQQK